MKKSSFFALLLSLILNIAFVGCDTSNDVDYELSRDCLVSGVIMGNLQRTLHTLSSKGEDSTYVVTVTGTMYPMHIDQKNNLIFNLDSLPVGTDVSKVTFSTFNASGTGSLKSMITGKDTVFVASDSTDFTVPRVLTVYSAGAKFSRQYTIDIRVHREEADTFAWQTVSEGAANNAAAHYTESRAVVCGKQLLVFGKTQTGTAEVVVSSTETPDFSRSQQLNAPIYVESVQYFAGKLYALNGTRLMTTSADAPAVWTPVEGTPDLKALAGAGTDSLYAVHGNSLFATANGTVWVASSMEAGNSLPTENICASLQKSRVDESYESVILTGTREGKASVWKRDIDRKGDYVYPWINLPQTEELGKYACPVLTHTTLISYDDAVVLTGLTAEGKVAPFYVSRDYGRTWRPNDMKHPAMPQSTSLAVAVDADHYVWVVCSGTGNVYKGRINRLGWAQEDTRFDRSVRR